MLAARPAEEELLLSLAAQVEAAAPVARSAAAGLVTRLVPTAQLDGVTRPPCVS